MVPVDLQGLVRAARDGDPSAWAELVDRFQDRAMASALGWSGSWANAADIAQDAFRMAYEHLGELREPDAFGGWFAQLVRTACTRSVRRAGPATVAWPDGPELEDPGGPDPAEAIVRDEDAAAVRAAIEALPPTERVVVALFYLAEMSFPDIAGFLGIGLSAAKKRGFCARRHLKELLPMASEILAASRPSRTGQLRDTVLLFSAIHARDTQTVRRLVQSRPELATAAEDWTPLEAAEAEIGFSQRSSALIRAAETGVVEIAQVLLDAGAPVDGLCRCDGGETPLWAASVAGLSDMVLFLLSAGADPNAAAFRGATPLHVAVMRERHDIVRLLLEAGADADRADAGGRTPGDWARTRPGAAPRSDEWLWTGIRTLDLFAPIRKGSLQWWPAAVGAGQFVITAAVHASLAPEEIWYIGFDQRHVDANSIRHGLQECALAARIHLARRDLTPVERRRRLAESLALLQHSAAPTKVVVCLSDQGHAQDIDIILPGLRSDPSVLTTIVIEPSDTADPHPGSSPPEGFDMQVAFDRRRIRNRSEFLLPAVEPLRTASREYPSDVHRVLAERARAALRGYEDLDPELGLGVPESDLPGEAAAAPSILRYLGQHLGIGEPFTSEPAEVTGYTELIGQMEVLLRPSTMTPRSP